MNLLLKFPDDKTEYKKEEHKKKLLEYMKVLKAKRNLAVAEAQKAYKLFRCFVGGESQTQWNKIMHEMNSKDLWISVNSFLAVLQGLYQAPQAHSLLC